MKNIVLCFDSASVRSHAPATNVHALWRLLEDSDDQLLWWHPGGSARLPARRRRARAAAQEAVVDGYGFITEAWQRGDRIFLFGAGHGAYCARTLCRLLDTVGVLPQRCHHLLDYLLATYALPRRARTAQEWRRLTALTEILAGRSALAVPVHYLGLWDTVRVPGLPRAAATELPANVRTARHAVAIDGSPRGETLRGDTGQRLAEVWFRGVHADVAGGPRACRPLANIALGWVLDGALRAGLAVQDTRQPAPVFSAADATAGHAHTVALRRLPPTPQIHASVQVYLNRHPAYWRRLPAAFRWADPDWAARGERLLPSARPRRPDAAPAVLAHSAV